MKKLLLGLCVVSLLSSTLLAKGGFGPALASCCIGPRVGLEMNEGSDIRTMEWIEFGADMISGGVGSIIAGAEAGMGKSMNEVRAKEGLGGTAVRAAAPASKGGIMPFLGGCCLGPRVGLEMNDGRNVRTMELLTLVPVVQIVPMAIIALEAYGGKTMSEVAAAEGLDR